MGTLLVLSSSPSSGSSARRPTRTSPTPASTPPPGSTPELEITTTPSNFKETTRRSSRLWITSPTSCWTDAGTNGENQKPYLKYGLRNSDNCHWLTSIQSTMENLIKLLVLRLGLFALDKQALNSKISY